MDNQDLQTRRADNQIWNGAANYGQHNRFRSFGPGGEASLYFNTVMGLVRRYYDYDTLEIFLIELENHPQGDEHCELFWLGLERCVWLKGRNDRPVLTQLRQDYARSLLAQSPARQDRCQLDGLKTGWFSRALGESSEESAWETGVLDDLEFPPELSAEELRERMERLLTRHFRRTFRAKLDYLGGSRVDLGFFGRLRRPNTSRALRRFGTADTAGGGAVRRGGLFGLGVPREERVRQYVEGCFGRSMLPESERLAVQKKLCTGVHKHCYLYFTRGDDPVETGDPATQTQRAHFAAQAEKNWAYYEKNLVQNRLAVDQLAQRLRNTLLLRQDDSGSRCRSGSLISSLAWRALALGDERIFSRPQNELPEDLVVDILLDASASQSLVQEQLAAQAYILAQALSKCRIPARVMSYCSVSGCTVMRVYRDYQEDSANSRILEFAAAGWNRDGLALRALNYLLGKDGDAHRLVLILSDATPNDDQRMGGPALLGHDYSGKSAIRDTTQEAGELRRGNRTVLCLFSGFDSDFPNARAIYGRDVLRLPGVGWLAETVGNLIQVKLQALSN